MDWNESCTFPAEDQDRKFAHPLNLNVGLVYAGV